MAHEIERNYESPAVNVVSVILLALGFVAFAGGALLALHVYFSRQNVGAVYPTARRFPQPRLETRNGQDYSALSREQRARAENYAWVDREHGLVRIPVARAMAIIAARKNQAYDPPESSPNAAEAKP